MPVGANSYPKSVLPDSHWEALFAANTILIDQLMDDLKAFGRRKKPTDLWVAEYLPRMYVLRYDEGFLRRFLVCAVSVGLKMRAPDFHPLGCTAEELVIRAMKEIAEAWLKENGEAADFGDWEDIALDDIDVEYLYDPQQDGIEDSEIGRRMGIGNLGFQDWFRPFNPPRYMHPYANNEEESPWDAELGYEDDDAGEDDQ